ncbi:MAG: hypothetical protein R2804_12860 [Cyclobacteriaceae bacterium]
MNLKDIIIRLLSMLGLVWVLSTTASLAQNIETIGKEKPVTVSGGVAASQIFYAADGIESRRDPYSYFLTGNLNLSLYGWSVPLSFALSNQNRSFQQPFNQFGIHPTYKWVTGHFGYANMSFSPYTLSGHIFRGAGVELAPGKFHFSAMVGQLQRAVPVDTIRNTVPAFERNGFGFKTGYRDGGNFAELSVFRGEDDRNSLSYLPEDNSLMPEENLAIGLSLGKTLFEKFSVQLDYGSSSITRDIRDEEGDGRSPFSSLGGLFTPRTSTSYYNAYKLGANYNGSLYSLGIGYERIDPGYRTHGAYYFNNDLVNYTVNGTTSFFDSKLSVSANVGIQNDNLDGTKISMMRRFVGAVNASYAPTERLSFSSSYSNFQSFTNIRSQFVDINQLTPYDNLDTLKFTQITQSINVGGNYSLKATKEQRQFIFVNVSVQDAAEKQSQVTENSGSQFYNVNTSYSLSFIPTNLTLSFSYNINQNKIPNMDLFTHGPTASINKALMERKLRLTLSTSYNSTSLEGKKQNSVTNIRSNASYLLAKKHNFGLSMMVVNRSAAVETGPSKFTEYTGTLSYSYSF